MEHELHLNKVVFLKKESSSFRPKRKTKKAFLLGHGPASLFQPRFLPAFWFPLHRAQRTPPQPEPPKPSAFAPSGDTLLGLPLVLTPLSPAQCEGRTGGSCLSPRVPQGSVRWREGCGPWRESHLRSRPSSSIWQVSGTFDKSLSVPEPQCSHLSHGDRPLILQALNISRAGNVHWTHGGERKAWGGGGAGGGYLPYR